VTTDAFPGERQFVAALAACAAAVAVWVVLQKGSLLWLAAYLPGLALSLDALALLRRFRAASRWPEVHGRMLAAGIEDVFVADEVTNTEYRPQVLYEYGDGQEVKRGRDFGASSSAFRARERSEIANLLLSYRPGTPVTVKVCPTAPDLAVLRTDLHPRRRSGAATWRQPSSVACWS
jgi:hypothetical protein